MNHNSDKGLKGHWGELINSCTTLRVSFAAQNTCFIRQVLKAHMDPFHMSGVLRSRSHHSWADFHSGEWKLQPM